MFLRAATRVMDEKILSLIIDSIVLLKVKTNKYFPSIDIKNYH